MAKLILFIAIISVIFLTIVVTASTIIQMVTDIKEPEKEETAL